MDTNIQPVPDTSDDPSNDEHCVRHGRGLEGCANNHDNPADHNRLPSPELISDPEIGDDLVHRHGGCAGPCGSLKA